MDQDARKPMLTPLEPAADAGFEGEGEHRFPKPRVAGSNPVARSKPHLERVFNPSGLSESHQKADAHPLPEAGDAFLLTKQVAGCSVVTVLTYSIRRLFHSLWGPRRFYPRIGVECLEQTVHEVVELQSPGSPLQVRPVG